MTLLGRFAQPGARSVTIGEPPGEVARLPGDLPWPGSGLARRVLDAKVRLHRKLIDDINLAAIEKASHEELRRLVAEMVSRYVLEERLPVNAGELGSLIDELIDEMTGLGPIEPLLKDPSITDILINTHNDCYVERAGVLERVPVSFKDEAHLLRIINKIVAAVGRRVDESQPMVDVRLPDGSRVNVAVRPVAVDGPLVSIRNFAKNIYSLDRLVEAGSLKQPVATLLAAAVRCRLSLLISGGTGSGKTTLLNALSQTFRSRND